MQFSLFQFFSRQYFFLYVSLSEFSGLYRSIQKKFLISSRKLYFIQKPKPYCRLCWNYSKSIAGERFHYPKEPKNVLLIKPVYISLPFCADLFFIKSILTLILGFHTSLNWHLLISTILTNNYYTYNQKCLMLILAETFESYSWKVMSIFDKEFSACPVQVKIIDAWK